MTAVPGNFMNTLIIIVQNNGFHHPSWDIKYLQRCCTQLLYTNIKTNCGFWIKRIRISWIQNKLVKNDPFIDDCHYSGVIPRPARSAQIAVSKQLVDATQLGALLSAVISDKYMDIPFPNGNSFV